MRRVPFLLLLAVPALSACAGGATSVAVSPIAGSYATTVTLGENTCSNVTVQNMPTVVSHTAGATTFVMTHSGQTYNGTLAANLSFATAPLDLSLNGNQYTINITGAFAGSTLEANVRLDVVPAGGGTCFYFVHWAGTRTP